MGSCWDGDFNECKVKAEQGDARAQFNLGQMYQKGKGVSQDYVKAHMFYNLAVWNGYEGKAKEFRDSISRRMLTPYQRAKAQRLARQWMQKHQ
jgi:TPR repeat protein